jgi:hypothetical protein
MDDDQLEGNPSDQYSDASFWEKATKYAKVAGEEVFKHGFTLYYCLQDDRTPTWAQLPLAEQDRIDAELRELCKDGVGKRGHYLKRLIEGEDSEA